MVSLSASRTGRLYPQEMFLVFIFTRGWVDPMVMVRSEGNMSLKKPVTPPGIVTGTVRLEAQHLNHYATPGPQLYRSIRSNWTEVYDVIIQEYKEQFNRSIRSKWTEVYDVIIQKYKEQFNRRIRSKWTEVYDVIIQKYKEQFNRSIRSKWTEVYDVIIHKYKEQFNRSVKSKWTEVNAVITSIQKYQEQLDRSVRSNWTGVYEVFIQKYEEQLNESIRSNWTEVLETVYTKSFTESKVWGSHDGHYNDYSFLACDTALEGARSPDAN